jgi:hypothetical protein
LPFGPSALGVAYFTTIKLVGYSVAGRYINRTDAVSRPAPLTFGVTRTALGIAAGISYGFALSKIGIANTEFAFYGGLLPVRTLEWLAVLWLFYRGVPRVTAKRWRYVGAGIGWSYVLDIPAVIAAFTIPGGFWVC